MSMKHNPIKIIKTVGKATGVEDARENEYNRIVVTFYDDATEENRQAVKDYMDDVGYVRHDATKHKIIFRSE